MRRGTLFVAFIVAAIVAGPVAAQETGEPTGVAAAVAAAADTLQLRIEALSDSVSLAEPELDEREIEQIVLELLEAEKKPEKVIAGWTLLPEATLRAQSTKVTWSGALDGSLGLRRKAKVSMKSFTGWEDYRKQDRTIETRNASLSYGSGRSLPLMLTAAANWRWSDDQTVNTAGFLNQNRSESRSASFTARRDTIMTGALRHQIVVDGKFIEQQGLTQSRRTDLTDGTLSGGLRSAFDLADGVVIRSTLYGKTASGDKTLGATNGGTSSEADSLGCALRYRRSGIRGHIILKTTNATKRYIDYKRNPSGGVDTVRVAEADKIVEEHEKIDAMTVEWDNGFSLGAFGFKAHLARSVDEQTFAVSGVGTKEKLQDEFDTSLAWRYSDRDSVRVEYRYQWRWDDQTYQTATVARGKQINRRRNVNMDVNQHLIGTTKLRLHSGVSLSQSFAENQFNDNDRDRLDTSMSARLDTDLGGVRPKPYGRVSYQHSEDISIRAVRSGNNNHKDLYEIAAGYSWPVSSKVTVKQDYKLSIQYTDYLYSYLEQVRRSDDYNKRGLVTTEVKLKPSERLTAWLSYDWNTRFNATRVATDAAGNDSYQRDVEQRVGKIDVEIAYRVNDWCTLEGATYRTRDTKDTLTDERDAAIRFSGQLWVGMDLERSWGDGNSGRVLKAAVRRYFAYGPTVQEYNADYIDADVSFTWRF